ncbi:MAG: hypothetical protein ACTSYB_11200 [Candidatus Helarchaeota archaeon]
MVILKWLVIIGGYIEVFIGILFLFIHLLLEPLGVPPGAPIFSQLAGCMFICFGILLIFSAKDIEKYSLIIKVNCLLRFIIQPAVIYNMVLYPVFIPLLLGSAIYDIGWAIIVLFLLKN